MNRKKFLKNSLLGLGSIIAVPNFLQSCKEKDPTVDPNTCEVSPTETSGPFPIKTPADFVRENIVGNRNGIPLLIYLKIENVNNNCSPLENVFVDIWHCDTKGNYSEYDNQIDGDLTNEHFLRGRQLTDKDGIATFISIYPGWYPGRAPHIHLEVKNTMEVSLLVTQIAFPEDISNTVYDSSLYNGPFDTSNEEDGVFVKSLYRNIASTVTGNNTDGYTLIETIKVSV